MSTTPTDRDESAAGDPARPARAFHTVPEAADLLRVDPVTIYRAIRANAFPAVKIRGRYSVPTQAIDKLVRDAVDTLACVDVADYVLQRRADKPSQETKSGL